MTDDNDLNVARALGRIEGQLQHVQSTINSVQASLLRDTSAASARMDAMSNRVGALEKWRAGLAVAIGLVSSAVAFVAQQIHIGF